MKVIRPIEPEDIVPFLKLAHKCFNDSSFEKNGLSFDFLSVVKNVSDSIKNPNRILIGYFEDKKLLGICGFILSESVFDSNVKILDEALWHADPELSTYKRAKIMHLLLNFIENCDTIEYNLIQICLPTSNSLLGHYLLKKGFNRQEIIYGKRQSSNQ